MTDSVRLWEYNIYKCKNNGYSAKNLTGTDKKPEE